MNDISVLTPSYDYGRFIPDAIQSVIGQQGVSVEHFVQDALSKDATLDVLQRFPSVTWTSEADRGQSDALNRAFASTSGTWVAWLNADEFYLPGALSWLHRAGMRTNADVVFGDAVFVDADGRFLRLLPQHPIHRYVLRHYGPTIPSCAALFRRDAMGDAPWDPSLRRVMDWELYLRLLAEGARMTYVPIPIGAFRVHESRVTAQPAKDQSENDVVRTRYGVRATEARRRYARAVHALLKGASFSYHRQYRTRSLGGKDLRWFASESARDTVDLLMTRLSKNAVNVVEVGG